MRRYTKIEELPPPLRRLLPVRAQEIYRAVFNHAYLIYGEDDPRVYQDAWRAVKAEYHKDPETGYWVPNAPGIERELYLEEAIIA